MREEVDLLRFPKIHREVGCRTEEHREVARRFDREFFDGSRDTGYGGYQYDGRWQAVAARLVMHYSLRPGARVLDVGCAKGFLVADLRELGIDAFGIDVSEYAISKSLAPRHTVIADAREIPQWRATAHGPWDLIVSINTLHNLERGDLARVLRAIDRASVCAYITVDAWRDDAERERMQAWNLTARTMMSVHDWRTFFRESGYSGDHHWFVP